MAHAERGAAVAAGCPCTLNCTTAVQPGLEATFLKARSRRERVGRALEGTDRSILVYFQTAMSRACHRNWEDEAGGAIMPRLTGSRYVLTRNCPMRDETACCVTTALQTGYLMFFDGQQWSAPFGLTTDNDDQLRTMDIAYGNSGMLLWAYWTEVRGLIGYNTYDGERLTDQLPLAIPTRDQPSFLALYPEPGTDVVLLLARTNRRELFLARWDGTAWGDPVRLTNDASSVGTECFSVAFEGVSGRAIIVWGEQSRSRGSMRTLTCTTLSPPIGDPPIDVPLDDDGREYLEETAAAPREPEPVESAQQQDQQQ